MDGTAPNAKRGTINLLKHALDAEIRGTTMTDQTKPTLPTCPFCGGENKDCQAAEVDNFNVAWFCKQPRGGYKPYRRRPTEDSLRAEVERLQKNYDIAVEWNRKYKAEADGAQAELSTLKAQLAKIRDMGCYHQDHNTLEFCGKCHSCIARAAIAKTQTGKQSADQAEG